MINKLSSCIVERLLRKKHINNDESDMFEYGLFQIFSHIFFVIVTLFCGGLFKCIIESIIFYIAFQFVRIYAGGYHAKTETQCEILSSIMIFVCVGLITISKYCALHIYVLSVTVIAYLVIWFFSPIDTPTKPLNNVEHKHFRKISILISSTLLVIVIVSLFSHCDLLFFPCCVSLVLEGFLLCVAKINLCMRKKDFG